MSTNLQTEPASAHARDLRVDFFRGLALFVIFWDHLLTLGKCSFGLFFLTPAFIMFSDAAELFVFLSGYVFGLVYLKVLDTRGFRACFGKAIFRAWELYRANVITLFACLGLAVLFYRTDGLLLLQMDSFIRDPLPIVPAVFALTYSPFAFGILALYMLLLLTMPLLLWLHQRRPRTAWVISGGLYLTAQFFPDLNLPRYQPLHGSSGTWYFNPLAWQFLFFIGMILGAATRKGKSVRLPLGRGWLLAAVAFIGFSPLLYVGGIVFDLGLGNIKQALDSGDLAGSVSGLLGLTEDDIYNGRVPYVGFPLADKRYLQPVRLLHFFSAVYIAVRLLPADMDFWKRRWARAFELCGRHSLEVFCLSIALDYAAGMTMQVRGTGPLAFLTCIVAGATAMVLLAALLNWKKQRLAPARG